MEYIVSISSNYNQDENIARVKEILSKEFANVKFSSIKTTKPVGLGYPPADFRNTVVSFTSRLYSDELKDFLRDVEAKLGRDSEMRKQKLAPIDLDIIIVGHEIVHRDYARFLFLRQLVAEVRPVI